MSVIMARRMRPERVSRYFIGMLASWLGLIGIAIDDLDGPDDEDFAGIAGLEECIALAEWNFRLIDFDNSFHMVRDLDASRRSQRFLRRAAKRSCR